MEKALIALKKGSQLIKYSRKGKPKLRSFRLSTDETTLIWQSHKKEKLLKLSTVTKIIPGQRTAVFRRFLRPEKDYLSFSLIYKRGQRSLDLICKDQTEVEVWFTGLQILISQNAKFSRSESTTDGLTLSDEGDPFQDFQIYDTALDIASTISCSRSSGTYGTVSFFGPARSDVGLDRRNMRASISDGSRVSVSSAPSSSSQGSGPDDIESLGDVYVWGEVWSDNVLPDGRQSFVTSDSLLPKPLESNVVLDVQQIACGFRHVALITRQGEVFTWGEECGGRLGHGTDADVSCPKLVESLAVASVDYVACGEYLTCAVTASGDLYNWGDGYYNLGLLGHGEESGHWLPKRVYGPLEGLQVLSIACGVWHTALATSIGKVFTFGDGAFGVLGHGNRENVAYPKEVESLSDFRTIKVACGVWHTAAIVEVAGQGGMNVISRKLFTWGDGDKFRLGHGDKEAKLIPTCVPSLIDYNFHQLGCGHNMTVALTTSGHVFTMGSTSYGQLGNPQSNGKLPCLVQDRLVGELVEEIACGAFHVAALTSRSEVFTWGRGENGRLGHGDAEDRKTPTLVEALRDRHVRNISCGSNFTACICIHKWVSGADQSICSGCRQAFGFTRKRHNCYNCGLVHCHACSSKKVLKAALAPTPGKPHRVCDSCYAKLKAAEAGNNTPTKRNTTIRRSLDNRDRERMEQRTSKLLLAPSLEIKYYGSVRNEMKADYGSLMRTPQVSTSLFQLKDLSLATLQTALRPMVAAMPPAAIDESHLSCPLPRRSNVPPASPQTPAAAQQFNTSAMESMKKTNELLNQEVLRLQAQVNSIRQIAEHREDQLRRYERKAKKATSKVKEESAKCNAALDFVESFDSLIKALASKLPADVTEDLKGLQSRAEALLVDYRASESESAPNSATNFSAEADQARLSNGSMDLPYPRSGEFEIGQQSAAPNHRRTESTGCLAPDSARHGNQTTEQFEHGVYVTYVLLPDGVKVFKRVRFSRRRFAEREAEEWWKENQEKVFRVYKNPTVHLPSTPSVRGLPTPSPMDDESVTLLRAAGNVIEESDR